MGERTDELNGRSMSGERSDRIREDIHRTQAGIEETVDTLQYRLSPDYIKYRMKQNARRKSMEARDGLIAKIKANPLPAAMIGAGLFMMMRNKDDDHELYWETGYEIEDEGMMDRARMKSHSAAAGIREKSHDAADAVREKTHRAAEAVKEEIGEAADHLRSGTERARQRAALVNARASVRARRARTDFWTSFNENPLAIGAIGLAVGALLGTAVPESDREVELMGDARERLGERVKSTAREKAEQVRHVATAAAGAAKNAAKETAKQEAKRQGLTEEDSLVPQNEAPRL